MDIQFALLIVQIIVQLIIQLIVRSIMHKMEWKIVMASLSCPTSVLQRLECLFDRRSCLVLARQ